MFPVQKLCLRFRSRPGIFIGSFIGSVIGADFFWFTGKTPLILARNGRAEALIAVADRIKPGSAEAVRMLKEEGVHVVMLTGDNRSTAEAVAREAGVDEVISDVLPAGKRDVVRAQQAARKGLVAMVGDGVNDAPALMEADVGIAIGSGTDVAMESSDIVLLRNDLRDVVGAMKLSRRTIGTIKRGLFWAFFYNSVCVLLSTGLFYYLSAGAFRMEPMYGAIAMSLSSVSVVLNALTINFFRFHPESHPARNLPDVPSSDGAPEKHKEEINMQEIVLKVKGMMCMHCVAHVEEACRKVEGVVEAKASLETDSVTVKCREGTDRAPVSVRSGRFCALRADCISRPEKASRCPSSSHSIRRPRSARSRTDAGSACAEN